MSSTINNLNKQDTPTSLYQRLINDSRKSRILFRVHDSTSAYLLHWTGNPHTSGFSSLNLNLQALTPTAYTSTYGRITGDNWLKRPHGRTTLVNHALNRSSSSSLPDDQSPWISTTKEVDWAVWEIARRLSSSNAGKVELSVIRQAYLSQKAEDQKIQTCDEVRVEPLRLMDQYLSGGLSQAERKDVLTAKARTRQASEVLYYGRIFGESIEANHIFTREALPIFLPSKYWRAAGDEEDPNWLSRLRWDPSVADWSVAKAVISGNVTKTTWSKQPLHTLSSSWPPNDKRVNKWAYTCPQSESVIPVQDSLPLVRKDSGRVEATEDTGTLLMRTGERFGGNGA